MASYLDLRHAVAKLSSGDIVSNELYYRGHCYKQMCNDFAKKKNEESKQEGFKQKEREDYIKAVSFNKVLTHVHEGMSSNNESGVNFQVGHLESLYKELLEKDNISYSPNVTRFCESLIEALPHDVEKRRTGKKLTLFAKKDIDAYLLDDLINPNSFITQLNKIVCQIRKSISCQQNKFDGTFSENCQSNAVPKELLTLISMIIDGTSVTSKLSQASLTCVQLINKHLYRTQCHSRRNYRRQSEDTRRICDICLFWKKSQILRYKR